MTQLGYRNRKRRMGGPARQLDPFDQPKAKTTQEGKQMARSKVIYLDGLTGDPDADEEAASEGGHSHPTKDQRDFADALIEQRIAETDRRLRQLGVTQKDEFWDEDVWGPAPLGMSENMRQRAYEEERRRPWFDGQTTLHGASRQQWDEALASGRSGAGLRGAGKRVKWRRMSVLQTTVAAVVGPLFTARRRGAQRGMPTPRGGPPPPPGRPPPSGPRPG